VVQSRHYFSAHPVKVNPLAGPIPRVRTAFFEHFHCVHNDGGSCADRAERSERDMVLAKRVENVNLQKVTQVEEAENTHALEDESILELFHSVQRAVLRVASMHSLVE